MKKHLNLFLLLALFSLVIISCKKEDDPDPVVKNLVITHNVTDNVVDFTATAENAVNYSWNFGNGTTGTGATAQATYDMKGDYWVKCTATGATSQLVDSVEVTVKIGNPEIFNDVAMLLCGYDPETGESNAVWHWAAGSEGDVVLFGGEKRYHYQDLDSAVYSLFDPIATGGDIWWSEAGPSMGESYNDAYSFKLNQSFDYACDYKEDGLCLNWAYAYYRHSMDVEQYSDVVTFDVPKTGSWKLHVYNHADEPYASYDSIYKAPATMVDGVPEEKSYFLEITGGAWLFQEVAEPKYQILSITADTVFVRWEVGLPGDFPTEKNPPWDYPEWLSPGEGEWQYSYLVKTESTPPPAE